MPDVCWIAAGGTQGFDRKTFAVLRMRGWASRETSTRFTASRTHFRPATYSGKDTNSRAREPVVDMTSMSVGANRASSRRWSGRISRPTSCRAPVAGSTTRRRDPSAPPPSSIRPSASAADVGPRVPPDESCTTASAMGIRPTWTAPTELVSEVGGASAGRTTAAAAVAVPVAMTRAGSRRRTMPSRVTLIPGEHTTCLDALSCARGGPTSSHRPQLPHQPRPRGPQEQAGDDVEEPT